MRIVLILLVLLSVLLSASSQILLKLGMIRPSMQLALASNGGAFHVAQAILTSPLVLCGMGFFGLSAIVWLFVLAKVPLSSAYPFVALGIAITVIAGRVIFAESISLMKLVGVALVIAGVLTVAASS
jgi:multidrug transporter EmrE-like cation transporter